MTAVTASQYIEKVGDDERSFGPAAASTYFYGGTLCFFDSAGRVDDDDAAGVNRFAGVVVQDVDNSSGSAGDLNVEFYNKGRFLLTGSGFAQTSVGQSVFAIDNYTIQLAGSSATYIGVIKEYVSATQVWVEIDTTHAADDSWFPTGTAQSLSGAGAINVTSYLTKWTTTSTDAGTLADGTRTGQMKKIQLIVDGGDGTLTPTSLSGGTTITFADAGDTAILKWDGTNWVAIELSNDADGATGPVLA